MKIIREACVSTKKEFDEALKNHADQFELCSRLDIGGLTPNDKMIQYVIKKHPRVMIMIRNRKDFFTTTKQTNQLISIIKKYNHTKVCGYVFGFLTKENKIDVKTITKLINVANKSKEIVFHMAFDQIKNKQLAIEILIALKVTRVLTKGDTIGPAIHNIAKLKTLKKLTNNKIQLIIGGNVNNDNYLDIYKKTKIQMYHGRKLLNK